MTEHANCLQCGASIAAEDGGLCLGCAAEVHGPEPEEGRCTACGAAIAYVAGVEPGITFRVCPQCDPDELDALMQTPPAAAPNARELELGDAWGTSGRSVAETLASYRLELLDSLERERRPIPDPDPRFNGGLLHEVFGVLTNYGYKRPIAAKAYADSIVALLRLVEAFEGKGRDS